jgi:uncharacterized delta-60 repeat protein
MGAAGTGPSLYPLTWPSQIGLIRLLPDGSRDRTFGRKGFVAWNPPWRGPTGLIAAPELLLPQADGRLLVAATVNDFAAGAQPWRVAFVRFNKNGSVDESFGRAGVAEALEGPDSFYGWAGLPGGQPVVLRAGPISRGFFEPPSWSWSLYRFTADGELDGAFGQDESVRLGEIGLDYAYDPVPAQDGSLVIVGRLQGATPLRRVLPGGQLDARFGTACGRPPLNFESLGGAAATSDGGLLATAIAGLDSYVVRYGPDGCAAGKPLLLGILGASPPALRGRRTAMVGATNSHTLALMRIRR